MENKTTQIIIRLSEQEKKDIEQKAKDHGFRFVAEFVRVMMIKGTLEIK